MKVVLTSNYNLEHIADILLHENVSEEFANNAVAEYNKTADTYFAIARDDAYRLWRGMDDLI